MERKGVRDRRTESASGKQIFFSCWVRVKRKKEFKSERKWLWGERWGGLNKW